MNFANRCSKELVKKLKVKNNNDFQCIQENLKILNFQLKFSIFDSLTTNQRHWLDKSILFVSINHYFGHYVLLIQVLSMQQLGGF